MTTYTTKLVRNGEVELWTEQFKADGPACLLIGGAGAISSFWPDEFCQVLAAAGYHVIRYDHRDSGLSSFVDFAQNPYDLTDLVDDALGVLDSAGFGDAHVVGHSMGGFIAQTLAIRHPGRVRSFTSISSHTAAPDVPPPHPETWEVLLANQPSGNLDDDLNGFMTVWKFLNGNAEFDVAMAEAYTRELYDRNPRTLPATNHVAIQADMEDRTTALGTVRVPGLIIHGAADPLVPVEAGRMIVDATAAGRWLLLPTAGHMFFNPSIWKLLADEISGFFVETDEHMLERDSL